MMTLSPHQDPSTRCKSRLIHSRPAVALPPLDDTPDPAGAAALVLAVNGHQVPAMTHAKALILFCQIHSGAAARRA